MTFSGGLLLSHRVVVYSQTSVVPRPGRALRESQLRSLMRKRARILTPNHPRYEVVRRLGAGGSGAVFLARDRLDDDNEVALKVSHGEVAPDQLLREFRLLRRLRHSGIARAFDFGRLRDTSQAYFTLEYVAGPDLEKESLTLRRRLAEGHLDAVIDVFLQVVSGLKYLHEHGLLHLDVKPSNVVFAAGQAKLIDFGLFQNARTPGSLPGRGTVHYTSPEVLDGRAVDPRADLYSLGVLFYRTLSGRYPISGKTIGEIAEAHRLRTPPPLPRIPEGLSRIVMKLLAKSPRHRFQDAAAVEKALQEFHPLKRKSSSSTPVEVPDFVGRRKELRTFFSWLDSRLQGSNPRLLVVEGEPGMGKTRFVDACLTELLGLEVDVFSLSGHQVEQGNGLGSLLQKMATVYGLSRKQRSQSRLLLTSVGLSTNKKSQWEILEMDLEQIRARTFQEAIQLFAEWRDRPIVLIVDDFHKADPQLVDFIRRLASDDSGSDVTSGISVVLTQPAGFSHVADSGDSIAKKIRLRGLKRDEITRSLVRLAGTLGERKLEQAARSSRGNLEVFVHLIQQIRSGRRVPSAGAFDVERVRRTRLLALSDDELRLVVLLRLLNRPTSGAMLRKLTEFSKPRFETARRSLTANALVRASNQGLFLAPDVDDETLFARLGDEELRRVRERIGRALKASKQRLHEAALHLMLGGQVAEGLDSAREAGKRLHELGRVEDALQLYSVALDHVETTADKSYFLEAKGDLLNKSGQFDEAERAFEALAGQSGLAANDALRVKRKLGGVHQRSGDNDAARRVFEDAMHLVDTVDDIDEHLHLLNELAALHLFRGDFSQSTTFANRGLELLGSAMAKRLEPRVHAMHDLNLRSIAGHILLRQFEHGPAAEEFLHSLKVSERIGTLSNTALILNNLGVAYFLGNRLREALRVYNRAATLARKMGDDTALFSISCNVAGIRARLGEIQAARELLATIEEMPHPRRSKRARLFFLHTQGLVSRVTLQDSKALWDQSIQLADEIPDPVLASYGRVYAAENEIHQGRWEAARRILDELDKAGGQDARLRRAIDSRRAYLDCVCDNRAAVPPLATQVYVFDRTSKSEETSPDYGTLWDWIFGARALMELGKDADADFWLDRARSVFARFGQAPGVLECSLQLAENALRQRDAKRAARWLAAARRALALHDTSGGSVAASVRLPYLEARLGILESRSDRTYVSDRIVDARGNLPFGVDWEIGWLLNLVAEDYGEPGAARKVRATRERFLNGLQPTDRRSYEERDHRQRLGLAPSENERQPESEASAAADRRLSTLSALREARDVKKALDLVIESCGSRSGAVFLNPGSGIADARAVEGTGSKFPEDLKRAALATGNGELGQGLCVEIRRRGGQKLGVLYVLVAKDDDSRELFSFLQLAAQLLADVLTVSRSFDRVPRESTPLLVEDSSKTASLAATTFVESSSPRMLDVFTLVQRTRDSRLPVLLTGESGVGKDLIARWVHTSSPYRDRPFVALDCAAIPEGLLEAELFGYEAGAFTGADRPRVGRLVAAEGGTVYLDHVDSISLEGQTKLLRVLEDGEIRTLGGGSRVKIDARFIASTQRDLAELGARGQFRTDLYFRLSGIRLSIPPLRERIEDIPALVARFQRQVSGGVPEFSSEALEALKSYAWPGNVRELESIVRRLSLTVEGTVNKEDVAQALGIEESSAVVPRWFFEGKTYDEVLDVVKREYLLYLFDKCEGDTKRVARELNTTRRNVYQRYMQAGIRTVDLRSQGPHGQRKRDG